MLATPHRTLLIQAADCLNRGDLAGAEAAATPVIAETGGANADSLFVMGMVRLRQGRAAEAADLLDKATRLVPRQPPLWFNLGIALAHSGQAQRAITAFAQAVGLQPELGDGWYEMGNQQLLLEQFAQAETSFSRALAQMPGHGPAKLGLGRALLGQNRAAEAEAVLIRARDEKHDPALASVIAEFLAKAQTRQYRQGPAIDSLLLSQQLDSRRTDLDGDRVDLLLDLTRFDEALALLKTMLAREPGNPKLHQHYNDVLYQLGREEELLASHDEAPPTREIRMNKAMFALTQRRGALAHKLFADILADDPGDIDALVSMAAALDVEGRHDEAMALAEKEMARRPGDPRLQAQIASTALLQRDPQKAEAMLEKILAVLPHDAISLARIGTAWRMMDDDRDEALMGYDDLVRVFDLEAPSGFSDMGEFNRELEGYLASLHPPTREFLGQSLRGGTQTRRHLFGAGHDLVDRLQARITDAIGRYIAELEPDAAHPMRARRSGQFAFAGSWSSRLADCGFHANHLHPMGWISSCYYVGLPDVVREEKSRQGWIKFGEPDIDVGVSIRRAIQPRPGRLVLFPSYMWHGTIPFRADAHRTTIAFDVIPK